MKISTIMMSAAFAALAAVPAMAQDATNYMANANCEGDDNSATALAAGWREYICKYTYDANEEEWTYEEPVMVTNDAEEPAFKGNVRWVCKPDNVTYDGAPYTDPVIFIRWDSGDARPCWFVYEVDLPKRGIYELSFLAGDWNNKSGDGSDNRWAPTGDIRYTVNGEIGPQALKALEIPDDCMEPQAEYPGGYFEDVYTATLEGGGEKPVLQKFAHTFTLNAGKNYVEIMGSHIMTAMAEFSLTLVKELTDDSAVENIEAANVVSTKYFGLDGAEVVNPAQGSFVIERNVLSNGAVKNVKRVIR